MSNFLLTTVLIAMATSALATPIDFDLKAILARQDIQGAYTNITMGRATLNWGDGNPVDVLGQALDYQCGVGTQCDTNPWTQEHTVCPDNTLCNSCVTMNIEISADGTWPDDNMRQALIDGMKAAIGQGIVSTDTTTCPIGGGPYIAYYPGYAFTASQQASFVGMTVYKDDKSEVAHMNAAISVQQVDDNWCGSTATSLFGEGGTIAGAVGQSELSAVFGTLSAICGSGT